LTGSTWQHFARLIVPCLEGRNTGKGDDCQLSSYAGDVKDGTLWQSDGKARLCWYGA